MDSDAIEQAMSQRTKFMHRAQSARLAEQRLAQFAKLQQASFEVLMASPASYQNFLQRNFLSRRMKIVDGKYQPVSSARRPQRP